MRNILCDSATHYEKISLKEAFYIAGSYVMIKPDCDVQEEDEKLLKRLYLDAFEYLLSPHQSLGDLLEHIKEAKIVNNRSSTGRLHLMTIHQAKGLQFNCVFVPGLNEGILPHINSVEQLVNLEEERRLMYVAITRAMERLFVTYRRTQSGQPITIRSRFINEISGQSSHR